MSHSQSEQAILCRTDQWSRLRIGQIYMHIMYSFIPTNSLRVTENTKNTKIEEQWWKINVKTELKGDVVRGHNWCKDLKF